MTTDKQLHPRLVRLLKDACDRDWKDETPEQVVTIACNGLYWRDRKIVGLEAEIADLKRQVAAAEEAGYEEGWNDCASPDYNEKRGPKGALDAALADARRKGAEAVLAEAEWWMGWYGDPEEIRDSSEAQEHLKAIRALPLDAPAGDK